jgi:hypothetical protein
LENVISLSLIGLISSLVVCVFSTSIFCLKKSYNTTHMLNIAKKEMNNIEYAIDNFDVDILDEYYSREEKEYSIDCKIIRKDEYYNCYKIDITVANKGEKVKLNSYVVKN